MDHTQVLDKVQQHVTAYFQMHDKKAFVYHDIRHTKDVVDAATQIARHYKLDDEQFFVVIAAAWFHDTGYYEAADGHEEKSAALCETYLKEIKVKKELIHLTTGCILATKMPQQPDGLLQQIICDADLFHLGMDDFEQKSKTMRKEYETRTQTDIGKHEWRAGTIKLLQQHHYHTDYCRLLLTDKKEEHLKALLQKEEEWKDKKDKEKPTEPLLAGTKDDKTEKDKKKERPGKGIETMFRVSSSNHQRLSDMADNKAHIMITVNSIILSAIISLLLRRLEDYPYLAIPTFIILTISLTTMVFSILATRPSIPEGTFTEKDVDDKKVNLLFFGNFYRMDLEHYTAGMNKVMMDSDFLYGSLIKDIYFQGVVLGKKYRLLRASYNIFMFGLILSVIAFVIASLLTSKR